MGIVFGVIALVVIGVIAFGAIGREARRLDAVAPQPVFNIEDAVEYVANRLPYDVSATISHDDVRNIIDWSLEFFRTKGVISNGHVTAVQDARDVVVGQAETVDYVLAKAKTQGSEFAPAHVHAVLDEQLRYLDAIRAIGPAADDED